MNQDIIINSAASMIKDIRAYGFIPLFKCGIKGWSIEEMTDPEFWFMSSDQLGPWDWKVECDHRNWWCGVEGHQNGALQGGDSRIAGICHPFLSSQSVSIGEEEHLRYLITPDELFEQSVLVDCTPEESRQFLIEHVKSFYPDQEKKIEKII